MPVPVCVWASNRELGSHRRQSGKGRGLSDSTTVRVLFCAFLDYRTAVLTRR